MATEPADPEKMDRNLPITTHGRDLLNPLKFMPQSNKCNIQYETGTHAANNVISRKGKFRVRLICGKITRQRAQI